MNAEIKVFLIPFMSLLCLFCDLLCSIKTVLRYQNRYFLRIFLKRIISKQNKMLPNKSESFMFRRTSLANSSGSSTRSAENQNCRKNLREKFDQVENEKKPEPQNRDKSILSVLSFNDNTKRVLKNSAEKISKTINSVRTTFGAITQVKIMCNFI